ncbi:M48 family metallopeptidase [Bartonella sp. DGB1]|uniref:M48 family metallopeptidase n=1 Tax=Bartonella sp. DGB1 TaxID=3239807 RepID=UPI0035231D60
MITVNEIPVKVIRKKIKNLHLGVYPPNGLVRVAAPEKFSDESIRLAVITRLSWIKQQIKSFQEQPRQSKREMVSGEDHYYLGRRYLLDVVYTDKTPFVEIKNKKKIVLNINLDTGREAREKLLKHWYRNEMQKILPKIIKKWEIKSGLKVQSYGIRRMKTKWGSCNQTQKRIWLNLELIKKPKNCIEYVVMHEMVHFLERTHNDNFIYYMDRFMPKWRIFKNELNKSVLAYENW